MAISKQDIDSLLRIGGKPDSRVLSVYLEVDQSQAANLNRGFLAALKAMLRDAERNMDDKERAAFSESAEKAVALVSGYTPRGKSLVFFCCTEGGFLWNRDLWIPVRNQVRWAESPYVRPLLEALDEYERYAVVLVNKDAGRLFTVYMGEIEEHPEVIANEKSKHFKSVGKDTRLSSLRFQRRDDEFAHLFLKRVADSLDELAGRREFDRLALAGQSPVVSELQRLLSKKLQSMVVATTALPMEATPQDVQREMLRIQEEVERSTERQYVEELVTAASKANQAVLELQPTLDALRQGRIRKLVYADAIVSPGSQCTNCSFLFADNPGSCSYCGAPVRPVEDVLSRLAEQVADSGGEAEHVRGQAADRLRKVGGVGAFLRF